MTLAVAYSLAYDPTARITERSVFIATDSRITFPTDPRPPADDGAKVILLNPGRAVLAFAGNVELGEQSLALAAKLVRQEPGPTLERIKELTLSAFKKFYCPGADLWGLLGAVSSDGTSDSIWKLEPHNGKEMTAYMGHGSAMIGNQKAQAAYKKVQENLWANLTFIHPRGALPAAADAGIRHCTILSTTIDEMNKQGASTVGRPVQALLITKGNYWSFGLGKYNERKDEWEQVHPQDGEIYFRCKELELRDLRRKADDLRQRRPGQSGTAPTKPLRSSPTGRNP